MLPFQNIQDKLPWQRSVGTRDLKSITEAIVHHSAVLTDDDYIPIARYGTEANFHIKEGFGHIAYHLIVARDGTVYQTMPFTEVGYHAGNYPVNLKSIGICLDGDFTKQLPPPSQFAALKALMHSLSTEHPEMPKLVHTGFWGHREVRLLPTTCPGNAVLADVQAYRKGKFD